MFECKLAEDGDLLALTDGQRAETARFHAIWLRDNAMDAATRATGNGQRLITLADIPGDLRMTDAVLSDGALHITFSGDAGTIAFDPHWLMAHRYDRQLRAEARGWVGPEIACWDRGLNASLPTASFAELEAGGTALRDWLGALVRYGFVHMSDGPAEDGALMKVVDLFGYVRETNYGRQFEVRTEINPTNLAYTGLGLQAHTDNPYRDPVPTIQVLYCLESPAAGGDSMVVDGFAAARRLREENEAWFDLLADHCARFEYAGSDDTHLVARRPMIELSPDGELISVRFNNRSAAPPTDVPLTGCRITTLPIGGSARSSTIRQWRSVSVWSRVSVLLSTTPAFCMPARPMVVPVIAGCRDAMQTGIPCCRATACCAASTRPPPHRNLGTERVVMKHEHAIAALRELLGDRLSTGASVRELHASDEAYTAPALPDAVAFPENTEEVSAIARICAAHDCPIVPYGISTSLEGHVVPLKGGVTVDLGRMNRVVEIDARNLVAVVEPGVTRKQLNEELRATGLMFTVDPGANATIGGMASTRASGTNAVRYGTMRENVMALEVVLADGQVIQTGTRARKSSAGYDLTHLFVGSEGTLGIITRITVRLFGQPEAIAAATCAFETVDGAVDSVMDAMQLGLPMAGSTSRRCADARHEYLQP